MEKRFYHHLFGGRFSYTGMLMLIFCLIFGLANAVMAATAITDNTPATAETMEMSLENGIWRAAPEIATAGAIDALHRPAPEIATAGASGVLTSTAATAITDNTPATAETMEMSLENGIWRAAPEIATAGAIEAIENIYAYDVLDPAPDISLAGFVLYDPTFDNLVATAANDSVYDPANSVAGTITSDQFWDDSRHLAATIYTPATIQDGMNFAAQGQVTYACLEQGSVSGGVKYNIIV